MEAVGSVLALDPPVSVASLVRTSNSGRPITRMAETLRVRISPPPGLGVSHPGSPIPLVKHPDDGEGTRPRAFVSNVRSVLSGWLYQLLPDDTFRSLGWKAT
jgi:hypothetical protein